MDDQEQYYQAEEAFNGELVKPQIVKPLITYALLGINVIMFLLTYGYSLLNKVDINYANYIFGEKVNSLIMQGEFWRLFVPIFLHGGIMHLAINSYSLYAVGPTVEKIFGRRKFLIIYLIGGVTGNIASFLFSINPSVGASGAIFGLMGALLYLLQKNKGVIKSSFGTSLIVIIVINLVYGFSNTGIDNFAHLGGLVGGFLSASALGFAWERRKDNKRIIFWLMILCLSLGGLYFGFTSSNNVSTNLLDQASKSFGNHDYNKTEELAHRVEKLGLNNNGIKADMYYLLAASLINQGAPQQAFEYAQKLVEIDAKRGHYILGVYYLNTKNNTLAKQELQKAYDLDPGNTVIRDILSKLK